MSRVKPNILITGTPGTGKSELAAHLAKKIDLNHIEVGKLAELHECYESEDTELQCKVLDEEKVVLFMQESMLRGNNVVDYHGSDFFDEEWFDIVFCLRTDIEILNKRYQDRGYGDVKIKNNIESEIFQVLLEEARDSYDPDIVHELPSNNILDLESNIDRVVSWFEVWEANAEESKVER